MVTLTDVAQRAGVSISVVSRVLNNDLQVRTRPETRDRVLQAAADLGYRPNYAGRALRSARTHTIALVVPDLFNGAFAPLFTGVQQEAERHDYVVLLARAEDAHTDSTVVRHLVDRRRVDGLLLQKEDGSRSEEWLVAATARTPVVTLNSGDTPGVPSVHLADAEAGALATRHLLASGHRRIAMVNGLRTSGTAQQRHHGYLAELRAAGVRPRGRWTTWLGYDAATADRALQQLWEHPVRPTAVVVANVNAAMGVLVAARRRGIAVPRELSVIGIHDVPGAENTWPSLTTVRMPMEELGRLGAGLLLGAIRGETVELSSVTRTPPELVVRESVAPPTVRPARR